MVIDPRQKRFAMNIQLRNGFTRAKPIRLSQKKPDFSGVFYFQKKPEFQNLASKNPNWQPCYTGLENAHKVRKKTFNILLCIEVKKT